MTIPDSCNIDRTAQSLKLVLIENPKAEHVRAEVPGPADQELASPRRPRQCQSKTLDTPGLEMSRTELGGARQDSFAQR